MSSASSRVSVIFIRGCGTRKELASISALNPNFLAMASKGGELANSWRWFGTTITDDHGPLGHAHRLDRNGRRVYRCECYKERTCEA